MTDELKVGDWVTSYQKGIWQVYRILRYKGKDPGSDREEHRTSIFSKRFVLNSFKRSFTAECCHPSFVKRLDSQTQKALDELIARNGELLKAFTAYQPGPVDCIYNARIGIPNNMSETEVASLIPRDRLFSEMEIDPYLTSLGFDTKSLPAWTVQFRSKDHRCREGYLDYEFQGVFPF
jgi:hypothetical protein